MIYIVYCDNCGCRMRIGKTFLKNGQGDNYCMWFCDNNACDYQIPSTMTAQEAHKKRREYKRSRKE